ncbi:carboxypeptidase regulatory-like domain-containing protein [Finegoldia magna]|uniref:Carboxypeptidase regulatory-like domain-containing protein n=1 Tax=Finegoldia magna TaxID=1260 RepID=A0A2N6SRJ9_FINMA|nr:carboxypeptidase-like regulatory domain-containing protein [Finegoldia magna]MDU2897920.1 carboxypeptidase-like regulatory domain-containing protein [Finegoldia magna]MDU5369143.1 carboxypeptidase-like regulatory domain-containing protein [Finegoldia magna]MDU5443380.1 carboxypeptidase-like regulatory domain-containing protein [Finegoldia magna]PMC59705.1 carboxypeptidase regulatory-like domain-containing protein [Finegoldia magna]
MKIFKKLLLVLVVIVMIPQITTASEIDKIDNIINPNREQNDSISKKIMQNFKSNLSFAVKQAMDEDNAILKVNVLDKKSKPIPKVEIIVTDLKTGKSRENQTDEKGEAQFYKLAPSEHSVKVVSAPSGYFFDEQKVLLENNTDNSKTLIAKTREDKDKKYKITYRITDKYGVALKEIDVKLKSNSKEYLSKTDMFGYAYFEVEDIGKYEVYVEKMSEYFEKHDNFKINDIEISPNSEESIYSSQIDEQIKKEFESALIINVKKADKPQEKVLVSLKDIRTGLYAFQYTNKEGKAVFDNLFPGNYFVTVNNEDRLTENGVGGVILKEGQVREFDVVLSQSDLSKKSLVVEKKEHVDEKLPESGNKDERMMVLFSVGIIVLAYLYLNKQKRENNN